MIHSIHRSIKNKLYLLGFVWNGSNCFINRKDGYQIEIFSNSFTFSNDFIYEFNINILEEFIDKKFLYELRKLKIEKMLK